jgi:hypothetical protein
MIDILSYVVLFACIYLGIGYVVQHAVMMREFRNGQVWPYTSWIKIKMALVWPALAWAWIMDRFKPKKS